MSAEYIKSLMAPYSFKMPPPAEMKVIAEVLVLFKRLPCLWDQAHHLYHVKEERDRSYNILLDKYKTIYPDATRDILKKKIDNMRNAYRREYKKVIAARLNKQMEHIPVLWYYHHLTFLDEKYENKDKDDNCSTGTVSETTENSIKLEEDDDDVTEIIEDSNPYDESQSAQDCEQTQLSPQPEISPPPQKKIRFTFEEQPDTEVTQSRQDLLEDINNTINSTKNSHLSKSEMQERMSETFGRTVGLQLQELEPMQRYIAEKLISDVIFFGRLRKLNMETSIK